MDDKHYSAELYLVNDTFLFSFQVILTEEPDTLYQKVSVLVKGHDKAVLDSYEFFAILAARELGVTLGKV